MVATRYRSENLQRYEHGDLDLADHVVSRLEADLGGGREPALQLWPLQCRAVLAGATGDEAAYVQAVREYRDLAERLDARGHIADARLLATRKPLGGQPSFMGG